MRDAKGRKLTGRSYSAIVEPVFQYFGLGEVTGNITVLPPHLHSIDDDPRFPIGSVGYPRTGIDIAILDAENRRLPPNATGEICVRGPAVFAGYYNNPAATEKAFAAGADIKEMAELTYPQIYLDDLFSDSDRVANRRKPIIAAVNGFALGGGCELALMCDFILAGDNAKFGQPEINLGVLPGMGGTQRLTRAVGKAKAMEMCLSGRLIDAVEAERCGIVARIVPSDELLDEALKVAAVIASKSLPIAMMIKESVNRAFEVNLTEGVRFERRVFHAAFATQDQKEGMAAFIAKREADFKGK